MTAGTIIFHECAIRYQYFDSTLPSGTSLGWPLKAIMNIDTMNLATSMSRSAEEVEYLSLRVPREYLRTSA